MTDPSSSIGAIVGGAIAVVLLVTAAVVGVLVYRKNNKKNVPGGNIRIVLHYNTNIYDSLTLIH